MRAFASGCTAMTGVEAVSNGVSAFQYPTVRHAHRTLATIVLILGMLLAVIAYLAQAYHVGATDQTKPDYQSVLSQLAGAIGSCLQSAVCRPIRALSIVQGSAVSSPGTRICRALSQCPAAASSIRSAF